jgi:alcohol dehydrogenase class IV
MDEDIDKLIALVKKERKANEFYGLANDRIDALVSALEALVSALEQAQESNTGLTERASENAVRLAAAMRQREAAEADLARAREALAEIANGFAEANDERSRSSEMQRVARAALAAGSGDE